MRDQTSRLIRTRIIYCIVPFLFQPNREGPLSRHAPYYRWFPKDYNADTYVRGMTDDQDLVYRRLLDASWEIGPLPDDLARLAALARFSPKRFETAWSFPLTECWKPCGKPVGNRGKPGLINPRLETERAEMIARSKSQSEKGKKGGRPRNSLMDREDTEKPRLSSSLTAALPEKSRTKAEKSHPDPDPDPEISTATPSRGRLLWWNGETNELDCEPEYAVRIEELFPVRRQALRAAWTKFSHWLGTPKTNHETERRRRELIATSDLSEWFENRLREDFADELSKPRNMDERIADRVHDVRRRRTRR